VTKPFVRSPVGALTIGFGAPPAISTRSKTAVRSAGFRCDRPMLLTKDRPRQSDRRLPRKNRRRRSDHSRRPSGKSRRIARIPPISHHIWEHDPRHPEQSRIEIQTRTHELFAQLRPTASRRLIFASLSAIVKCRRSPRWRHGLRRRDPCIVGPSTGLPPTASIQDMRRVTMGTLIPAAATRP